MEKCETCLGLVWVCEKHKDKPMGHDDCYGAGEPCPKCNPFMEKTGVVQIVDEVVEA